MSTAPVLHDGFTMKIIAADVIDTGAESQKCCKSPNDADLAELAGSGALEGWTASGAGLPSSPTAAPSARPCCCAAATALRATSVPRATC